MEYNQEDNNIYMGVPEEETKRKRLSEEIIAKTTQI